MAAASVTLPPIATLELEANLGMPEQRTMYLAVDSPKSLPKDFLQTVPVVETAFDNDDFGNQTTLLIQRLLNHATRANFKNKAHDRNQELLEKLYLQQQKRSYQPEL